MLRSKSLRLAQLLFLGVAVAMSTPVPLVAGPPPTQGVRFAPIGNPTWKPVDFHLFSAPVGTAGSGYVESFLTGLSVLPPPKHIPIDGYGIGPGVPHGPPYDSEVKDGVEDVGYHEGWRFDVEEFSNGNGVFLAWMNVPAPGKTGTSPDFKKGPIVPNRLFPIDFTVSTFQNENLIEVFSFSALPLDARVDRRFAGVNGPSHFPAFLWENADFLANPQQPRGSYLYQVRAVDREGNGWFIEASFEVGP